MNASGLIPLPDSIPAPAWLFLILDNALFLVHILLINTVVGGSLIALLSPSATGPNAPGRLAQVIDGKLSLFLPLGITAGVAPLLFMQVVYGHLFYTSSVLMAVFWIAVIPLLILAYYGTYIYARQAERAPKLARLALGIATLFFLYIAFIYVNNMTLMNQPEHWIGYFRQRSGTLLNWLDPTLFPRYLHFLSASVAVASLVIACFWQVKAPKESADDRNIKISLRIFAWATVMQVAGGFWFLLTLPSPILSQFMGRDLLITTILALGALSGIGAMVTGFTGQLRPTLIQAGITLVAMVITRNNLRALYLQPYFTPEQLAVTPQYSILGLFLVILLLGLVCIGYMVRLAFAAPGKGGAS